MDKKVYERTRYQNIYRHKKNKNYIITISKPIKTSISEIDGKKIFNIDEANKIKNNYLLKEKKAKESIHKETFKTLWEQYINFCEKIEHLSFNTMKKKKNFYNTHLKIFDDIKVSKISRNDIVDFLDNLQVSNKQKNELLKITKGFFNWCVKQDYILKSPTYGIKDIKTVKNEMKYWSVKDLKKFLDSLNDDTNTNAYLIKILTLIVFNTGCRIGELRALTWDSINEEHITITINHSINYNTKTKDYLSNTKNYQSQRTIDISKKLLDELQKYKTYLKNKYKILNNLIFYNYNLNKPYSDTNLRKYFYRYIEKANVPIIRLYDLRHTYVATMMAEGWELYHISKRIGHKNYSTTVDKYGHIPSEVRKEIAKTTDKYF